MVILPEQGSGYRNIVSVSRENLEDQKGVDYGLVSTSKLLVYFSVFEKRKKSTLSLGFFLETRNLSNPFRFRFRFPEQKLCSGMRSFES